MNWHVALVRSGEEAAAFEALQGSGFEAVWPRWDHAYVVRGKKRERTRSMASGYLLCRFDGLNAQTWHAIRTLCDGYGFIGGEHPDPVREKIVEDFLSKRCLTRDGLMAEPSEYLGEGLRKPGEVVRLYGLWEGHLGQVRWDDNRGVKVSIELLGRDTDLYLPYPDALELETVVEGKRKDQSPQYGRRHMGKKPVYNRVTA
jgi:transcription antitermination factor NusG